MLALIKVRRYWRRFNPGWSNYIDSALNQAGSLEYGQNKVMLTNICLMLPSMTISDKGVAFKGIVLNSSKKDPLSP